MQTSIVNTAQLRDVLTAYARVKQIPLGKVLRNMARDFVRAAEAATPLASRSQSEFYYYKDESGERHYLHANLLKKQVSGAAFTKTGKPRKISLKAYINQTYGEKDENGVVIRPALHKVRIAKGWSRAIWAGARQDLGMERKMPPRAAQAAPQYGEARVNIDTANPRITLVMALHFEKRADAIPAIMDAGTKAAFKNTGKDIERVLKKAWR